jgi:lipoprotein-anchoring transpeptidase ErfK/SrfK
VHLSNISYLTHHSRWLAAGLLTLACSAAPAMARDDRPDSDPSLLEQLADRPEGAFRTAQFWPFNQPTSRNSREQDARYYYVQSRDFFGRPGPVYRVLGVEKPKKKKPAVDRHKMRAAELLRKTPPPPPTTGPLLVTVSLSKQQLTIYDQGVAIATTPISTGTPKFPTPTGVFSVIQKQWWHRSNLYSAAPMPFMQRLTWSGIALHAGELPGYPASHGCIRLPDEFAVRLWHTAQIATRVVISYGEVAPLPIAHPRLFTPKPKVKPDPADTPMALRSPSASDDPAIIALQPLARQGQISVANVPVTPRTLDRVAASEGLSFLAGLGNSFTLVNPDGSAVVDAADDDVDDDERLAAGDARAPRTVSIVRPGQPTEVLEVAEAPQISEQGVAKITVMRGNRSRPAEIEVIAVTQVTPTPQLALPLPLPDPPVAVAHTGAITPVSARRERPAQFRLPLAPVESMPKPALRVTSPPPEEGSVPATPRVEPSPVAAESSPESGEPQLIEARTGGSKRYQMQTETPPVPPAPQARPLRPGPISVFVSRKERRMFVRKGFEPLFDVPVTVASPERALGTHVFTAISVGEADARWNVVSLPVERVRSAARAEDENAKRRRTRRNQVDVASGPPPVTAREALDRIELPSDAVARVSELLSAGATLIVSDEGLGRETGRETDFTVVLTK